MGGSKSLKGASRIGGSKDVVFTCFGGRAVFFAEVVIISNWQKEKRKKKKKRTKGLERWARRHLFTPPPPTNSRCRLLVEELIFRFGLGGGLWEHSAGWGGQDEISEKKHTHTIYYIHTSHPCTHHTHAHITPMHTEWYRGIRITKKSQG